MTDVSSSPVSEPRQARKQPQTKKSPTLVLESFGTVPEEVSKTYHASKTKLIGSCDQKPMEPAGWRGLQHVNEAAELAVKYALSLQNEDGHWVAESESNCSIQAEYVMLRKILGLKNPAVDVKLKNYLLQEQQLDGGWSLFSGAPSCPSVTAEAYFALKLLGERGDRPHMVRAREFVFGHGGLTQTRIFTRVNFALFGMYDWAQLPALPPEIMLVPDNSPLTIYDMSSWARGTVVPLLIIFDKKLTVPLEPEFRCDELYLGARDEHGPERRVQDQVSVEKAFIGLDKLLWAYERLPKKPLREKALKAAERWILERQEKSGDWAGIFPPMVNSILALRIRGYADDHPVIKKGLDALHHFIIEREDQMRIQCTNSPLWDTALILTGLLDCDLDPVSPAAHLASDYILKKQILTDYGDWRVKNKKGKSGGWSFEYFNTWYPDTDDTAALLLALHRIRTVDGGEKIVPQERYQRAMDWLMSMQCSNGGWAAFDINNTKSLLNRIPFADLKSMLDPPTADITGRVLELIGLMKARDIYEPHVRRALTFVKSLQCHDGSWWGRWGVNYIYGTCHVLMGLSQIGEKATEPHVQKALSWLKGMQNPDGGWGESCLSYNTSYVKAKGDSSASQTAWALMGLMSYAWSSELARNQRALLVESIEKGILWLLTHQRADGTWEEKEFTGTGFPQHFYLRYHAYRHCFPMTALGRYQKSRLN
jgi:squalene-hopene/tetraprenyl-beta-curcumene cyclase